MYKCYRCEEDLTAENHSLEHVIINACGGKLKSYNLLCSNCNSAFGNTFDNELASTTNDLCNLLLINRERGVPQRIKGTSVEDNKEYYLEYGGGITMTKPDINLLNFESEKIEERKIQISAPNEKQFNQVLLGLKRKYPNLNIKNAIADATYNERRFKKPIVVNSTIGGKKTFRSILKTAVNFYILNGGKRKEIKHLLPYLEGSQDGDYVWMHYPNDLIYEPKGSEVTHILKVVGDPTEKILYAFVELFNVHCFIVKLNTNYTGEKMDIDYIFNVHSHLVETKATSLSLSRTELITLFTNKDAKPFQNVQKRYERVLKISEVLRKKHFLEKTIDEELNKIFQEADPDEMFDERTINRMKLDLFNRFWRDIGSQ